MTITLNNLSAVIVAFHSEDVIHNCIKSITDKIQIIVVENSGNKDFARKLEDKYKNVRCVLSYENLGMGAGNNLGIRNVTTDYAFILNPDIVLEKNAIEEIMIASKKLNTFGLLAPISNNKKYPNYKINETNKSINNIEPFKVESIDGFAMILNLKILKKIDQFRNNKFFDENIFLYLENDDLCKRINKFESIYIVPTSKVSHLGASAVNKKYSDQIELSRNWHWIWSKFYFNRKHYGFLKAFIDGLPSFFSAMFKVLFYSLINHKKKRIYLHRVLGFLNALFGNKSYYRPKIDN